MVLHFGKQNFVSGVKKLSAPSLRNEIDAFGCAAGEYDLIRGRSADKIGHPLPGFFVMLGGACAQRMQSAMHIGVFVLVIISNNVEHSARLLGAGGVVEVDQRMAVHALPQNRKILSERRPIELSAGRLVHGIICSMRWLAPVDSRPR